MIRCGNVSQSSTLSASVKSQSPSLKIVRINLEDCYVRNGYVKLAAVFDGTDDTLDARLLNLTADRLALLADPTEGTTPVWLACVQRGPTGGGTWSWRQI
jgi:type 1 fimbria pilin